LKTGNGTQTLSGALSYTGSTSVNGGALVLTKSLTSSSSVSLANTGQLQLPADGTKLKVIKTGPVDVTGSARIDIADNKLITTSPSRAPRSRPARARARASAASAPSPNPRACPSCRR